MSYLLVEEAVDKLNAYLQTNIGAKITAFNAAYGDFDMPAPAAYYVAEQEAVPKFPVVFILADNSELVEEHPGQVKGSHSLLLAILVTESDNQQLRRTLYRYVRAFFELVKACENTSDFPYLVFDYRAEYSPILTTGTEFIADARLTFRATRVETG